MFIGFDNGPLAGEDTRTFSDRPEEVSRLKDLLHDTAFKTSPDDLTADQHAEGDVYSRDLVERLNQETNTSYGNKEYTLGISVVDGNLRLALHAPGGFKLDDVSEMAKKELEAHDKHKPFDLALVLVGAAAAAACDCNRKLDHNWKMDTLFGEAARLDKAGQLDQVKAISILALLHILKDRMSKQEDDDEQ